MISHSPLIQIRTCSSSKIAHNSSRHHHLPSQLGRNLHGRLYSFPSFPYTFCLSSFLAMPYLSDPLLQTSSCCVKSGPHHISWANVLAWVLFQPPVLSITLLPCPTIVLLPSRLHIGLYTHQFNGIPVLL